MHKVQELFFQCLPSFDTSHLKAMVMEATDLGFSGNFFSGNFLVDLWLEN